MSDFKSQAEIREFLERHPENSIRVSDVASAVWKARDVKAYFWGHIDCLDFGSQCTAAYDIVVVNDNYSHPHLPKYQDPPLETPEQREWALKAGFVIKSIGGNVYRYDRGKDTFFYLSSSSRGFKESVLNRWQSDWVGPYTIMGRPNFKIKENKMEEKKMNLQEALILMYTHPNCEVVSSCGLRYRNSSSGGLEFTINGHEWDLLDHLFNSHFISSKYFIVHEPPKQKQIKELRETIKKAAEQIRKLEEQE